MHIRASSAFGIMSLLVATAACTKKHDQLSAMDANVSAIDATASNQANADVDANDLANFQFNQVEVNSAPPKPSGAMLSGSPPGASPGTEDNRVIDLAPPPQAPKKKKPR
jgi:hypothetical protein